MLNYTKTNELVINKSRFVSYLFDAKSPEEVKKILEDVKKEHKKATHICYAYSCKSEGVYEKYFDDGEPSQTAGKPILSVLQKIGKTNVLAIVVRYFGGIKLGAGGLVRAYTKATSELFKKENI